MSILADMLDGWNGDVLVNGATLDKDLIPNGRVTFTFINKHSVTDEALPQETSKPVFDMTGTYRVSVKSYMLKKATPEFDFMAKWNDDVPMPLMTMVGEVVKETRGMVYMELHGDITAEITDRCLACGKPITNPVSRYFGMGPVCGGHNYVSPFADDKALREAVGEYRKKLQEIKWSGWIIRSAITEWSKL